MTEQNPYVVPPSSPKQVTESRSLGLKEFIVLFLSIAMLLAVFLPVTRSARPAARRMQCSNNLKQIGVALEEYHAHYRSLPPLYTVDSVGKKLHSWRTLILPFLEQKDLYDSIDLTKPWNDPVNAHACAQSVVVFQCPEQHLTNGNTIYLAVVGENALFSSDNPHSENDITDPWNRTLMICEVDSLLAVPWMSPDDLDEKELLKLADRKSWPHQNGFHGLMADGSVSFLHQSHTLAQWKALVSIKGADDNLLSDLN